MAAPPEQAPAGAPAGDAAHPLPGREPRNRAGVIARVVIGALVVAAVLFVAMALRRPELPTFSPSPAAMHEVGTALDGPVTYTLDATDPDRWVHFDFSRRSQVSALDPMGWDVAFRRFNVFVNGGDGLAGKGGVVDLGEVAFDSVRQVPAVGYVSSVAGRDTANAVLAEWYRYSFTSHVLRPEPRVYAVRTADGRFAKLQFLSYYCPGAQPGCVTFRYVYQGAGGTAVAAPGPSGAAGQGSAAGRDPRGAPSPGTPGAGGS